MLEINAAGRVGTLDILAHLTATADRPLVVVGPSGAGKSSLLLMILGFLPLTNGSIRLNGRLLVDAARRIELPPEARALGYLPQEYGLFPHMTALENVRFGVPRRTAPTPRAQKEKARALLDDLGAGHVADRRPSTLSGGERQRVALARALATEPEALLLDEPLAALDTGTRRRVRRLLADRLAKLGLPAIVVTHDPEDARALRGRVAVVEAGRVVQVGTLDELRAAPATRFVSGFTSDRDD